MRAFWIVRQAGAFLNWKSRKFKSLAAAIRWIDRRTMAHGGQYYIRKERT